jgi:hypothetical protein
LSGIGSPPEVDDLLGEQRGEAAHRLGVVVEAAGERLVGAGVEVTARSG